MHLFCIRFGCPRDQPGADEFQLVQFILQFKATQFITGGVISAMVGSAQFYVYFWLIVIVVYRCWREFEAVLL